MQAITLAENTNDEWCQDMDWTWQGIGAIMFLVLRLNWEIKDYSGM